MLLPSSLHLDGGGSKVFPKRRYPTTSLHDVTNQKTTT